MLTTSTHFGDSRLLRKTFAENWRTSTPGNSEKMLFCSSLEVIRFRCNVKRPAFSQWNPNTTERRRSA